MESNEVREQIELGAVPSTAPDGMPLRILSTKSVREIARRCALSEQQIEIAALSQGVVPLRYARNQRTYTHADQIRLLNAGAAIVGLGGLGGAVLDILCRAGVGRLVLIDGDRFEEHNLNRQLLCCQDSIGELKVEAAARRAAAINGAVRTRLHPVFLDERNAAALIESCDVVLDCLDNIEARFILEDAARSAGIPMVSAAVAGMTGHVTTIFAQDPGLQLIYGPRKTLQAPQGVETALGCLSPAVMLMASVESAEALHILIGRTEELLRNRLWVTDLSTNTVEVISLA